VLLLLLFGIIDFGRALNAQITLTQAAREGARLASLGASATSVTSRTQNAATGLSGVTVTVTSSCPTGAGTGVDAVVQASYPFSFATPVGAIAGMFGTAGFGSTLTLTATGDMPCETLPPAWLGACGRCAATTSAARSACCPAVACSWAPAPSSST
jgi:Flp pilus assembly protein TadG